MDDFPNNAVAGPSTPRTLSRPTSPTPLQSKRTALFLPPPPPNRQTIYFTSTEDLLTRFQLLGAYDSHVRSFTTATADGASVIDSKMQPPSTAFGAPVDKGKGKEVAAPSSLQPHQPMTPAADGQDGEDDDGKGGRGKKNSYRHLIKGIPGKHSMKKDEFLTNMIQVPPKQRMKIVPFDQKSQREAFSVSLEGLKGWNTATLIQESAQAREDRKKRKELRKLTKQAHANALAAANGTPGPFPTIQAPIPTPAISSFPRSATPMTTTFARQSSSGTPRPTVSTPRPGSAAARPGSTKPTLGPVQIPPTVSRVATPRTGTPTGPHPLSAPPLSATSMTPTGFPPSIGQGLGDKRGKKRDRDEFATTPVVTNGHPPPAVNGHHVVGLGASVLPPVTAGGPLPPPKVVIGAKAGTASVRPRPVKKQRLDMQGQSRDPAPIQQQPTPTGV